MNHSIFDREKTTIETRCLDGIRKVPAWVDGYFAVHQEILSNGLLGMHYVVTHMPSGIALGPVFPSRDAAAGAMAEVALLLNDWAVFDPKSVTSKFRSDIRAIFERWRAIPQNHLKINLERALREYAPDLNGFDGEDS